MKKSLSLLICAAAMLLSGCHHKDLEFLAPMAYNIEVVFDWQKAPDHEARTMSLFLYSQTRNYDYYPFSNPNGGPAQIPVDEYTGICVNEDDIYGLQFLDKDAHETFQISTHEAQKLTVMGISTRGIPRSENQTLRTTPSRLWGTNSREISVKKTQDKQVITFYPEELVCHYYVDVLEVENLKNADLQVDAVLSSLAGGIFPGTMTPSEEAISHTFTLSANSNHNRLSSNFYTFGVPAGDSRPHYLTLYFALRDGTGKSYTFDVTNQVNQAPNPREVHIVVHGLRLPDIQPDMENVGVSISGWETVYIDIKP